MDDATLAQCQERSNRGMPLLALTLFEIPACTALLSDALASLLAQWWHPALFDAVLLMHFYFWQGAKLFILLPYAVLFAIYAVKYFFFSRSSSPASQKRSIVMGLTGVNNRVAVGDESDHHQPSLPQHQQQPSSASEMQVDTATAVEQPLVITSLSEQPLAIVEEGELSPV